MSFKKLDALLEAEGARLGKSEGPRPIVLVVDDDPTIRKSLDAVLKVRYEVTLCATAREGVAAAHERVCAAILDVKMGKNDGFWACNEIRKKFPDLPVIFYSAYQDAKDPYDIINEHRPFGYITKDGDVSRLLKAVDTAVSLHLKLLEGRALLESHRRSRIG
jgi:DNA-binding NarL/FixJ family response regulator